MRSKLGDLTRRYQAFEQAGHGDGLLMVVCAAGGTALIALQGATVQRLAEGLLRDGAKP